jgi:hypothetical protein
MTHHHQKFSGKWTQNPYNSFLDCAGFYLSYNPDTSRDPITAIFDRLTLGYTQVGPETAICVPSRLEPGASRSYYVLRGDHREELESRKDSLEACLAYFREHIDQAAPNSAGLPSRKGEEKNG